MNEEKNISAKVLGQIALMQSVVVQLPDRKHMLKFVCQGLKDIDTINSVDYVLFDEDSPAGAEAIKSGNGEHVFYINNKTHTYAALLFQVSDGNGFNPYVPYIKNFCNMLAVIFEEHQQRTLNKSLMADLELRVAQRTKKLESEIKYRLAAEKELTIANQQLEANNQQLVAAEQQLRATNQQLEATNQQLRNVLENTRNVHYSHNTDHVITFLSPQVEEILGYTPEEAKIKWTELASDNPINEAAYAKTMKAIEAGERQPPYELELIRKDGKKVVVEVNESPLVKNGKTVAVVGSLADITERKNALEALKESEAKFRTLFDKVAEAVFSYDPQTFEIKEANKATSEIYGYSHDELIGMSSLKLSAEVDKSKSLSKQAYSKGEAYVNMRRHKKKDGSNLFVQVQVYKFDANNKTVTFAICHDITEIVKTQFDLKNALEKAQESDRLKSAFLTNMSHEIRTPMNGILGFTGLLKEPQLSGEKKDKYIQVIERSGKRMLDTINAIIDISKIEAGQVKVENAVVSANKILDEQYIFFQREAKAKELELLYKKTLADEESYIVTDPYKLEGILVNLIKNAIKYTNEGNIEIGCQIKENKGKEFLEFFVKDTGIGIPSNRTESVFNRFEQADIEDKKALEGSGLGLAISKSYVEMLGGKISVKSKERAGSTFIFEIPYIRQSQASKDIKEAGNGKLKTSFTHLHAIIAEDDEDGRLYLKTVLNSRFKKIIFTATGTETVEALKMHPETDIILMDIKMPGMSGYEATREIRKFNRDVKIIAQTAYGLSGDDVKALDAGCDDYIAKPINKSILLDKIRKSLKNKEKS